MREFNLNSAEKYKDGSPMIDNLPVQLVRLMKRIECLENRFRTLDKTQDALEEHKELITINESNIDNLGYRVDLIEKKILDMCRFLDAIKFKFKDVLLTQDCRRWLNNVTGHVGSNFCGNCTHINKCRAEDGIYACELSAEIIDPDDSSCSMFEPPF